MFFCFDVAGGGSKRILLWSSVFFCFDVVERCFMVLSIVENDLEGVDNLLSPEHDTRTEFPSYLCCYRSAQDMRDAKTEFDPPLVPILSL